MIDSRKLKVFLTVAHCESYTDAARSLNTVQSTISHSIKDLEEDLACTLFKKVGKRMVLTDAAVSLLEHAQQIESLMKEARQAVSEAGKWGRSRFSIGASVSASVCFIPEVLRELNECYPHCTISILTGNAPVIMTALRRGDVDIAFSLEPENESQLEFQPVFSDELSWIVSPLLRWEASPELGDEAVRRQRFVIFDQGSYTCRLVETFFKQKNFSPRSVTFMGSMEAIKAFVKLGQGIGLMPAWVAKSEIDSGQLLCFPSGSEVLRRRWGVVHRKQNALDAMEESFLHLCVASIQNKHLNGFPIKPIC
ncbi:MAG: LysR family transcriptional regulator [Verrucomicrobia bacterium]|jgi:DNA-binding transcriptional LysR family regulator|nr:LysR family transcriptional regulator [Verrucomicrobiota bacterium]